MDALLAIFYTLLFLLTIGMIWSIRDQNAKTQAILDRMDRRTVLLGRYLGMTDTDEEGNP
jgi:hypothetical protein